MPKSLKIDKNFTSFVVFSEDSIINALNKITANKSRIVFVVSESGILQGCLSDGDFRRWISSAGEPDLSVPVSLAMNRDVKSINDTASTSDLDLLISDKIAILPVLDSHRRIIGIARNGFNEILIGSRLIGDGQPPFVIAEIGNNHNGDIALAFSLIDQASKAGVDCVKFQMRDMSSLYKNSGNSSDISSDLGTQYTLDLLERFQLTDDELFRCFDRAVQRGVIPMCTPWDESSLHKLEGWGMLAYKVASADFTNHNLLTAISSTRKPLIASTGMASENEVKAGIRHLKDQDAQFILLHCNSTYPTPFKDVNLKYLSRLKELANAPVGYSGHERGIEIPIAAAALGAVVIEKHITIDTNMEGNDHKVSLLPEEFNNMVVGIRRVHESMGLGGERTLTQGEMMNREVLAKSLMASTDIPARTVITEEMITIQSPGQGLQPYRISELIGRSLSVSKVKGEPFFPSDLDQPKAQPKPYKFSNKFGIPVRYHDIHSFAGLSNIDLVEIHLSYKDLEVDLSSIFDQRMNLGLVVHAPELFVGDHTLDLCSLDDEYRLRSIQEMRRVLEISDRLSDYFTCHGPVLVVTNVGGFSQNSHLERSQLSALTDQLRRSLDELRSSKNVEIIPQTMPPYPWHFGGQRYHNLFVDPEYISDFCAHEAMRVCLDVSHSKLACNHLKTSFSSFLESILPHTAHLHLADAAGVDGEGLQIGEGEVDWAKFFEIFKNIPSPSFIPEIWQGHKNGGEGAWLALERLEKSYLATVS